MVLHFYKAPPVFLLNKIHNDMSDGLSSSQKMKAFADDLSVNICNHQSPFTNVSNV